MPTLIQQIIDKVINQSNLSALQVLGAALVGSALFQGLLTAVRTWLLIDTTDRMDILLGSQVIDKLLRLPLRFFEKRPVGELSQRLGELGTLAFLNRYCDYQYSRFTIYDYIHIHNGNVQRELDSSSTWNNTPLRNNDTFYCTNLSKTY